MKDDIGLPNGLTFLPNRRELCWVDAGKKQLNCIRTDGTGRRIVYSPLEYPFGLTHENEERFYWTDWKDHKVHSVSIYGDSYRSFTPSVVGQGKIYGILSMDTKCKGSEFYFNFQVSQGFILKGFGNITKTFRTNRML